MSLPIRPSYHISPASLVLGIETSCDETAAAVVRADRTILSNIVWSQMEEHRAYGGVVPEIAARVHIDSIEPVIAEALARANVTLSDIDAVAATCGPGLIGGVIVGTMVGKTLASVTDKPFIAVNHLEGHALTARLTSDVSFPYLLLLVSGGHCQFLLVRGVGDYERLGGTVDDALGEAYDKVAKMLGLGYPGGPAVEKLAREGNGRRFSFTVPMKGREGCDFSFSGLKTAVRTQAIALEREHAFSMQAKADLCASFQHVAALSVADRLEHAISMAKQRIPAISTFVVAGGVAANLALRAMLESVIARHHWQLVAPPVALCTDNAAMIAWAGMERLRLGQTDTLDTEPKARWPLHS